jgi:flagellar biosynthesis/type III secretory pathway M-ring protein FliF/YscJ
MAANWKLNAILGLIPFLLTYLFSFTNNTWQTSMFRACIGFLLFFVLGYMIRLVLNQMKIKKNSSSVHEHIAVEESNAETEIKKYVEDVLKESFQQISLQALHKGENTKDPEEVAQTIRTWTTQD